MSADLAKAAMRFMERADLKGSEVPAYVAVMNWLNLVGQQTAEQSPSSDAAPSTDRP